ncbi:uncharacterized protein [Physcomitrium patens]|uniref:uncharacterized protein isoform X3 n=1 Tax=Physcomitrium patens TaxID=3218 RepID=UPI003CCE19DF
MKRGSVHREGAMRSVEETKSFVLIAVTYPEVRVRMWRERVSARASVVCFCVFLPFLFLVLLFFPLVLSCWWLCLAVCMLFVALRRQRLWRSVDAVALDAVVVGVSGCCCFASCTEEAEVDEGLAGLRSRRAVLSRESIRFVVRHL